MPQHNHFMMARNASADSGASAVAPGPTTVLAQAFAVPQGGGNTPVSRYSTNPPDITLAATAITTVGGSQAHTNMMPYLVLTFCIALVGIFPSQN
jgi:microcystin-dependent protein